MTQPDTSLIIDEMAESMHMANAGSTSPHRRIIPRSGYSGEYNRYLIKQAEAALDVVRKYYELKERADV